MHRLLALFLLTLLFLPSANLVLAAQVKLPAGTPVELRLERAVTSEDTEGAVIPFSVVSDVKVDQAIIIPKGAKAIGRLSEAVQAEKMGQPGKIAITNIKLTTTSTDTVLLSSEIKKQGKHRYVPIGILSLVFFPIGLLSLLMEGKDASIPTGFETILYTANDAVVSTP